MVTGVYSRHTNKHQLLIANINESMNNFIINQLNNLKKEQGIYPLVNFEISLANIDLLSLLKAQNKSALLYPIIYWQDKDALQTIACFGCIDEKNSVPTVDGNVCYFGGLAFQQEGKQWGSFPAIKFVRPALEFKLENNSLVLVCHFDGKQDVNKTIELVQHLKSPTPLMLPRLQIISRSDTPNKENWARLVNLAIESKALLPKVVLSRETELVCKEDICHWDILSEWQKKNPSSFHFSFQFSVDSAFIGCSPERLFLRENNHLETEALAGTVNRGRNEREDAILLQSLLDDKKIDRENYLVQEFIIANLKQLKAEITAATPHVMQLHNVQHLCVPISATLCDETTNAQLLNKLHPTPAVGGSPKLPALQFITDNEPYLRGWYAGAVGYVREDKCDFSVAIRSALISKNKMKLFAGAGIVTGSIADQEWEELNNKISTVLSIVSPSDV